MKFLLTTCLFIVFTLQFSNSSFALVWVNSVTETNPPSTECTPTSLTVSGDLSANHMYAGSTFTVSGSTIDIFVNYQSGIGIQVITPFSQTIDLGLLSSDNYTVVTRGVLDGNVQSTYTSALSVGTCCGTSASFSYPTGICLGDMISLTNSSTGATSQEWFENGSSASSSVDHSLTPASAGNIVIKLVTSDGSCQDSVEYTIGVFDPPTVNDITPNQFTLCQGEQLDILSSTTNATSYIWNDNGNQIATSSSLSIVAAVPGSHVYQLLASNGGCADSMSVTVMINVSPTITSFSISESTICLGEDVFLMSSSTSATTIEWFENGTPVSTSNNFNVTPSISGVYDYLLITQNGNCADSAETTLTVNANPTIDNSNASHTTLCIGDTVNLTSSSANASTFEWFENGISVENSSNHSATPSSTGSYTYQLFVELGGCFDSTEHIVDVVALPIVNLGPDTSDCFGAVILDAGSGMNSYLWQDQSMNQTLTPTMAGVYSVTVTDANGCSNYDEMSFESCASILEQEGMQVVFYPNPIESMARIEIEGFEGNIQLILIDVNGKIVLDHSQFTTGILEVNLSEFNSGIYSLQLITDNSNAILRIIKE